MTPSDEGEQRGAICPESVVVRSPSPSHPLWCYSGPMLMIRIHVRRQSFPTLQPIVTLKICNGLVCMAQFMQGAFSAHISFVCTNTGFRLPIFGHGVTRLQRICKIHIFGGSRRTGVRFVASLRKTFFVKATCTLSLFKYAALTAITADRPQISSILPRRRVSRTKRTKVTHSDRVVSIAFRLIRPLGHATITESVSWMSVYA